MVSVQQLVEEREKVVFLTTQPTHGPQAKNFNQISNLKIRTTQLANMSG